MNEQQYRQKIREMLTDFYNDIENTGYCEKKEATSLHEFNQFVDEWIETHFTFVNEEETLQRRDPG